MRFSRFLNFFTVEFVAAEVFYLFFNLLFSDLLLGLMLGFMFSLLSSR